MNNKSIYQTTLKSEIEFQGIGLHSGKNTSVRLSPVFANTGILFKRADVRDSATVKATPFSVCSTNLATSIRCGNHQIATIEHLMAALYGMGVDNALVEVYGEEIPVLDGSALPFVEMIKKVGLRFFSIKRKYLKIKKRFVLEKDGRCIEILPSRYMKLTTHIDFDNSFIGYQKTFINIEPGSFERELAPARTFGFKKDVDRLWSMGLAKGGSLLNAVVIDNERVLNPEGLRMPDEFVRHKALDLLGDLALIGYRFFGHVRGYKSGHLINNIFTRALLESTGYYAIEELDSEHTLRELEIPARIIVPI